MSRGGRTHVVRNAYGHIEYLTDSEIANLRERGESIEVVGTYRGYPPTARNPLNQARVNELWQQDQEKKERERKERQRGRGKQGQERGGVQDQAKKAGTIASGIVTAAFGAYGAVQNPGMAANALPRSEQAESAYDSGRQLGDSTAEDERRRRSADMDGETRASGDRRRWSGKRR